MVINQVVRIDKTDSTNAQLKREINQHPSGYLLITNEQTHGKGQRGKVWHSDKGNDLTFSIYYKNPPLSSEMTLVATALAIVDTLAFYDIHANIKLPNDILIKHDKISGILIENILNKATIHRIIGVGINVNGAIETHGIHQTTSMKNVAHKSFVLEDVLNTFISMYNRHIQAPSFATFKQEVLNRETKVFFEGLMYKLVDINENFVCEIKSGDIKLTKHCGGLTFNAKQSKL